MTGRAFLASAAVAATLIQVACSDPISVSERVQRAFEGPLEFAVHEELASPGPGLPRVSLILRTVEGFASSATLEGDFELRGRVVTIRAREVASRVCNMPCITIAVHPSIRVPLPSESGEYTLRIEVAGVTTLYQLIVTDDALRIVPEGFLPDAVTRPVLSPMFDLVWRVTPRSLLLECQASPSANLCETLLTRIRSEVDLELAHFPAEGVPSWPFSGYFRYSRETDFQRVGEIVCSFVHDHPATSFTIRASNWLGLTATASRLPGRSAVCG